MSQTRDASMRRFLAMTKELQKEVRENAITELNAGADDLVEQMKNVAPLGPTGNLRRSIRKEQTEKQLRVKIKAGGVLTTVRNTRGIPYDYANAVEFGAQGTRAHPFFWPSWRLRKKRIRSRLKRKITANIKRRSA